MSNTEEKESLRQKFGGETGHPLDHAWMRLVQADHEITWGQVLAIRVPDLNGN